MDCGLLIKFRTIYLKASQVIWVANYRTSKALGGIEFFVIFVNDGAHHLSLSKWKASAIVIRNITIMTP